MRRFVLIFLSLSTCLAAEEQWVVDLYYSPYAGAQDIYTLHTLLERTEEAFFSDTAPSTGFLAQLGRACELGFLWDPLNEIAVTLQHEVFGHGYRIRSLGSDYVKVKDYQISLPPPYGSGGGSTKYRITNENFSTTQQLTISMGGVEASEVLASTWRMKWLSQGKVTPRSASLYLGAQYDLTGYVLGMSSPELIFDPDSGNDIEAYLFFLNLSYPTDPLTFKDLRRKVWVNFLDPCTYYALYSWFYYVNLGREGPLPLIPCGNMGYLPGARMGLTPFGPEYYFDNYFVSGCNPTYLYFRYGSHGPNQYYGVGLEDNSIWQSDPYKLGIRCNLWYQPKLQIHQVAFAEFFSSIEEEIISVPLPKVGKQLGGQLSLIGDYRLSNSTCSLHVELGYKTLGYMPGMPLQASAVVLGGFTTNF